MTYRYKLAVQRWGQRPEFTKCLYLHRITRLVGNHPWYGIVMVFSGPDI